MRLLNFVSETTLPTFNKASSIITNMFKKVMNDTSMDFLFNQFNLYLKPYNITFEIDSNLPKDIINGKCNIFEDNFIRIMFSKDWATHLMDEFAYAAEKNNIKEMSQIIKDISTILAHEMIHAEQAKKIPDIIKDKLYKKYAASKELGDIEKAKAYLSNPLELEAYAQQIFLAMKEKGESEVLDAYASLFGKNSPVYKKLLKKVYFYLEKNKE
jgi:hypothetical protein